MEQNFDEQIIRPELSGGVEGRHGVAQGVGGAFRTARAATFYRMPAEDNADFFSVSLPREATCHGRTPKAQSPVAFHLSPAIMRTFLRLVCLWRSRCD